MHNYGRTDQLRQPPARNKKELPSTEVFCFVFSLLFVCCCCCFSVVVVVFFFRSKSCTPFQRFHIQLDNGAEQKENTSKQ